MEAFYLENDTADKSSALKYPCKLINKPCTHLPEVDTRRCLQMQAGVNV